MYTVKNYPTKKALTADFKAGKKIQVFQPGGFFPGKTDGAIVIEGPHSPKPHSWYANAVIKNGIIIKVK